MIRKRLLAGFATLSIGLGVQAETAPQPDQVLVYKTTPQAELKLHVFNPPDHQPSNNTPAIVFFHGGGWQTGGSSQFFRQSRHLADRGMVAISADYRLGKPHKTTPRECIKDGKSAMRWVRAHAKELGINPDELAAGGGSAGGHIAAAIALVDGFNEEGEDQSVSCIPNALVLFNPVIDNGPGGYGHGRVKDYWKSFSPFHNISSNAPPTIFLLGTKDKLIPVATAKKYKTRMEEVRARCDLILYENQQHSFFNFKNEYYHRQSMEDMDRFLDSLGYLSSRRAS